MLDRIKTTVRNNKERIVIGALTVATGALAVYGVRTQKQLNGVNQFWGDIALGLGEGLVATLSEDRSMIELNPPAECHCPTEKPKTTKAKAAA